MSIFQVHTKGIIYNSEFRIVVCEVNKKLPYKFKNYRLIQVWKLNKKTSKKIINVTKTIFENKQNT